MSHASYLSGLCPKKFKSTLATLASGIKANFPNCNLIIGRGFSGAMIVPALAQKLKVEWALSRKEDDSHSWFDCEVSDWPKAPRVVFIDDLIESGKTVRAAWESLQKQSQNATPVKVPPVLLGAALYSSSRDSFRLDYDTGAAFPAFSFHA